jgi:antitoxin VapB
MADVRRARLIKNGRNQSVRIPRDLELPGDEVLIWREGPRLIVEPVRARSLREVLASLETLPRADRLRDLDDPPAEPVDL